MIVALIAVPFVLLISQGGETKPAAGGTLVEGIVGGPEALNPHLARTPGAADLAGLLFQGLTRLDDKGQPVPALAAKWQADSSGQSYQFELRPNLRWHDGQPLTAADVEYTLRLVQDPKYPGGADLAAPWQGVRFERQDDWRFRLILPKPAATFPATAALPLLPVHLLSGVAPADLPSHAFNAAPVGNGPFKLVAADAKGASLVPSPDNSDPMAKPYLDGLQIRYYPDANALAEALRRGEVQAASGLPGSMARGLDTGRWRVFSTSLPTGAVLLFNTASEPLKDAATRLALSKTLDRAALASQANGGSATVATGLFPPNHWALSPALGDGAPDPSAAQRLAGKNLSLSLVSDDDPGHAQLVKTIKAQWERAGVKVELAATSFAQLLSERLLPGRFDAALVSYTTPADADLSPFWHSSAVDGGFNFGRWRNPQADQLLDRARAELDPARRKQMLAEFQTLFANEAPAVPLYWTGMSFVLTTEVRTTDPNGTTVPTSWSSPAERYAYLSQWYLRQTTSSSFDQLLGRR